MVLWCAVVATLPVLSGSAAGATSGLSAGVSAAPSPARTYAVDAHAATNRERTTRDLRQLRETSCLRRMAVKQAERMARRGTPFHQDLGKVQRACGVGWAGENVAMGYPDGRAAVRGWMNSSGHRANILRPQFRTMGIGAVKRGGVWYVAQVFGD